MVITNGFPKSGNHALVKALQLLGQPCRVNHIKVGEPVEGQHVFIKRDPRNVICSWLRFNGQHVTPGMFLTAFLQFQERSLIDELAEYEGWLAGFVVRYEDLIASDAEMRRIAEHLNIPYIDGAFEAHPAIPRTPCADHADYPTIWTPDVGSFWNKNGGPDLLARWGY